MEAQKDYAPEQIYKRRLQATNGGHPSMRLVDNAASILHATRTINGHNFRNMISKSKSKLLDNEKKAKNRLDKILDGGAKTLKLRHLSQSDSLPDTITFPGESSKRSDYADSTDTIIEEYMQYPEQINIIVVPVENAEELQELLQYIIYSMMQSFADAVGPVASLTDEVADTFIDEKIKAPATEAMDSRYNGVKSAYAESKYQTQRKRRLQSNIPNLQMPFEIDIPYEIIVYEDSDPWWDDESEYYEIIPLDDLDNFVFFPMSDEQMMLSSALRMGAPVEYGGFPPALLQDLAEEKSETIEFLDSLVTAIMSGDVDVQSQMPRFSMFGAGTITSDSKGIVSIENEITVVPNSKKESFSDVIFQGLQSAVIAPASHTEDYAPSFDPQWWGIVFGMGGIVFLVVGGAISIFKARTIPYTATEHEYESFAATPSVKSDAGKTKPEQSASANRKLSGLPA